MDVKKPEEELVLPKQEGFFSTEKLRRSARAGTHLPDPTMVPYGYDPKAQFKHLFPAMELPALFPPASDHPDDHVSFGSPQLEPHRLYLGDNLYVLRGLPSESVDLIYIDPPFFSNRTYTQIWGDDNEVRSFNDIFHDGMFSYLAWLNARLWEMKRVLKSTGSIYVHCDWHASHYIKCEMDKIFGYDNLRNEIVWYYRRWTNTAENFQRMHDVLFWYTKTNDFKFSPLRQPYSERTVHRAISVDGVTNLEERRDIKAGIVMHDVWDVPYLHSQSPERLGYPTQKPVELLQRIVEAHTEPGDVIADFFMGGGSMGAAALGQRAIREQKTTTKRDGTYEVKEIVRYTLDGAQRRFVGCDVSRVAVSVTASRLVEIGEQLSGVTLKPEAGLKQTIGFQTAEAADIRIGYVGSYPMEKFRGIAHEEFVRFILTLYGAMPFTGQAQHIHGIANTRVVLSVGSGDPNERVSLAHVEGAVKDTLRQYQKQLSENDARILQIIGWSFEPAVDGWRRKTVEMLNKRGVPLSIELISLGSESFRQKIFRNVGEANIDLKFNRLNQLLSFTGAPYAGQIVVRKQDGLAVTFALEGAKSMGAGGKLINCQWDFDYDGSRFAQREYALNRAGTSGHFDAVLEIEHTFARAGTYTIAARVQDNLDGQATVAMQAVVSAGRCELRAAASATT